MKNLKIKRQDKVMKNKTLRVRETKIADAEAANYLHSEEELPVQFPINSVFNFFGMCNRNFRREIKILRT